MEKNNREVQVPGFVSKPVNKREISRPRHEEKKTYRPSHPKMLDKIKNLIAIALVSATVGATVMTGISVYNNQQTTRQAQSYEEQITDYNIELYNKVQGLEKEGFESLSNDELRMLIQEVNENNYEEIKFKISRVIPDFSGNLTIMRHEESNAKKTFTARYGEKYSENSFTIEDSRIQGAVERYIEVMELVKKTENGDVDRSKLEKEVEKLAQEMKNNADLGLYFNTKDGCAKNGALKTYSIERNKDKIEEKLSEYKVTEDNERNERD